MTQASNSASKQPFRPGLHGAFLRRTDLSGADFKDADLAGAVLNGADLTDARTLTVEQLRAAVVDPTTKLPAPLSLDDILGAPAPAEHPN